jgi:hypothetical protein
MLWRRHKQVLSRTAEHPWIVAASGAAALLILLIVLFGWTAGVVVIGFIAALVALFKDEFWHWRHAPGLLRIRRTPQEPE